MTDFTTTNQDAILREVYTDEAVQQQSYGENPLFAFIQKKRGKTAGGRRYIQVVEFGNPGGTSADYASAMSFNTTSSYEDFAIPRKFQYQRVKIAHELLFATEKKSEAAVNSLQEFDRGFKSFGEKIGRRIYRTQGGSLGQLALSSVTGATVLSFTDNAAVFNFQLGQVLQFALADGSGSLLDSGDTTTVTAVDHEAGTVTVADAIDAKISGITTSSFVFQIGDFNACLAGIEDWLPVDNRATKLAASFNAVTRSPAPVYLGGVYMDGTTFGALDEVFIKLAGKVGKYGGKPDYAFANHESLSDLELVSNSRVRIMGALDTKIVGESGDIIVGFGGYRVLVGGRPVDVYPDRNCPSNRFDLLQLNTWTLWHTGDLINWLGESYTGNKMQPSREDDSAESRLGGYMNIGCSAPGFNGVAKINPST